MEKKDNKKNIIIFLGPPGSGKGTQAEMLAGRTKLPVLSTGGILRQEVASGTALGKRVKSLLDAGKLVPDKIVNELLAKNIFCESCAVRGAIIDGYPRDAKQLDFLVGKMEESAPRASAITAIMIDVSDGEVVRRLGQRRSCACGEVYHLENKPPKAAGRCDACGRKLFLRSDDKAGVIRARLKLYHRESDAMAAYFSREDELIRINGERKIDKVNDDIVRALKRRKIL